jgi:SAM-dependent methyltransferase
MKLILELGSGAVPQQLEGAKVIHLDRVEGPHVEIVADLNHGIPLPANIFDGILALDVVEHLDNVVAIMDEMHRVLKPNGAVTIRVPLAGSDDHVIDPTHKRGFHPRSFDFFDDKLELGAKNGRLYTTRRWHIVRIVAPTPAGLLFLMEALKPGEVERVVPDLFGGAT